MKTASTVLSIVIISGVATLVLYSASLVPAGQREISALETIRSIPYPVVEGRIQIDEPLAHADVYLQQPLFAQELIITVSFVPTTINELAVGVRENSFWLSYPKYTIYSLEKLPTTTYELQTETVTIPLTDKLQEVDQSIDLMFFAEGEDPAWELVSLTTSVQHAVPTWTQFKDYARAIVYRERAL